MVLVFDLDDTLYDEASYVRSGFKEVAKYLSRKYNIPPESCYLDLLERLESGRGRIFDDVLLKYGLYSKREVARCLSVYRHHRPAISLYEDADNCLRRFQGYPLYIVTDGNKLVQNNKLIALGLAGRVQHCYITHRYGIKNAKPSPYVFNIICRRENTSPEKIIYVGDNPNKDFVGIKPLGFKTIRIIRGMFRDVFKSAEFEANKIIYSLDEINAELLKKIGQGEEM